MKLREKQSLFVVLVGQLISKANHLGYELTFGEAKRSPEEAARLAKLKKGSKNSLHILQLAIDFNLFKNGKYLDKTEDHRVLGEYWESLHPLARWGGRFEDGNHYSLEHAGRK